MPGILKLDEELSRCLEFLYLTRSKTDEGIVFRVGILSRQGNPIDLERLSWLSGSWFGTRGDDLVEVHYGTPKGTQSVMGMFRWIRNGKVWFFEFVTLEAEPQGLMYRIKHFHPGLVGWEEKSESVAFVLVKAGEKERSFTPKGKQILSG
jgi:hypothetical protein